MKDDELRLVFNFIWKVEPITSIGRLGGVRRIFILYGHRFKCYAHRQCTEVISRLRKG